MTRDDLQNRAPWIVCPMCDEPKCLGRFTCPEILEWIDRKIKEYGVTLDKHVEDVILG